MAASSSSSSSSSSLLSPAETLHRYFHQMTRRRHADENSEEDQELWASHLFTTHISFISLTTTPYIRTTFHYTVQPEHANRLGALHGGCISTLIDTLTTTPLLFLPPPSPWPITLGVTRTLSITCLRPAPVGTELEIECTLLQCGRRMCSMRAEIRRKEDGVLVAMGEHGKVGIEVEDARTRAGREGTAGSKL